MHEVEEEAPLLFASEEVEGLLPEEQIEPEGTGASIYNEQVVTSPQEAITFSPRSHELKKKELTKPRALEDSVVYRDEVVREMLKSERKYITDLTLLIELFLVPLREAAIISKEQIQSLFSTVELLLGVNRELFKEMEERAAAWDPEQKIGDVFLMLGPHFKIYTSYCRNYEQAMATLQACKKNPLFAQFLEDREVLPEVQKQDITSFLILPVQRIPRYILLLRDLKQNTSPQHPDYENISKAVEQYTEVTKTVNESIRNAERTNELLEIQRQFGTSYELIRPARIFVKKGKLTKITSRFVKETWFFLFNDVLVYAYEVVGSYVFKGEIPLGTTWIRDLIDTTAVQNAFQIVSTKKTYTVYASSTEEKKAWVMAIQKCIAALVAKKPQLIEQRSDINVRRSWLSWLPETVGLTIAPEQFDPHGAGYASTSSRSSLSSRSSGGVVTTGGNGSRPNSNRSSSRNPPPVNTQTLQSSHPEISSDQPKERLREKESPYNESDDVQTTAEDAPLVRHQQGSRASYYQPSPQRAVEEAECCCGIM